MNNSLFTDRCVTSERILYTPSEFAKESLTYLQEIGTLTALREHVSRRDYIDSYLFFLVKNGDGTITYENKTHELHAGDCVLIDCHQPYAHKTSATNPWTLMWVHFNGSTINKIYEKFRNRGGKAIFRPENTTDFEECYQTLYTLANTSHTIKDMRINEELTHFMTLLMEQSRPNENSNKPSEKKMLLHDIQHYIDENYANKISLDELSQMFFINKFYLLRIFKEQFGLTINDYLIRTRISHAKYLLRFTNKSIKQIGIDTGIGPVGYFSRLFKKIEGVSPSIYKQNW